MTSLALVAIEPGVPSHSTNGLRDLDVAVALTPENPAAIFLRLMAYAQLNQLEAAWSDAELLAQFPQQQTEALVWQARIRVKQGRTNGYRTC